MALYSASERAFATAVSNLSYCNPFLPERIANERQALGSDFNSSDAHWNVQVEIEGMPPNVLKIVERSQALADQLRSRLLAGQKATPQERALYEDMVLFLLFHQYIDQFDETLPPAGRSLKQRRLAFYPRFLKDYEYYLAMPRTSASASYEPGHVFACFFQLRRAFHHIFRYIIGGSAPAVRLRATVWQSIFTHDMRCYRRALYDKMGDMTSLITGPSGTGKELVARAIGLSRYIPFDEKAQAFREDYVESFHAINLSALSPTLIESELFGHQKGSFTGALQDRAGWLEVCKSLGTVFLDEVAEIDVSIQVKLLRVLESRVFHRLGDTQPREFRGKVIAATNRDMADQMQAGRFRGDLYYRLCSDIITTPSLHERIADSPEELNRLIVFLTRRIVGEAEALPAAEQVAKWIHENLGMDYAWPGNVRELEQCVRNVIIREVYLPARAQPKDDTTALAEAMNGGSLTAEEVLQRYCAMVYTRTGSLQETARRLGLDRRTVKAKVSLIDCRHAKA